MSNELGHVQKRLAVEGEKTAAFFESLSAADWDQPVYSTGSAWKVKQVLAHFISAERAYQKWIQSVLQGGEGPPRDMDIDAFNDAEAPALSAAPVPDLITGYRQARVDTIHLSQTLADEDLTRLGYHPWFGEKELGWYLKLLYRHNTMHLQDVRKAISSSQAVPASDVHRVGRQDSPTSSAPPTGE